MDVSTKQKRIAELAGQSSEMSLTSLNHYLDLDWLKMAYKRLRRDGAPGCDGVSVKEYGENLDENLRSLLDRVKSGIYRAPPVKRVHIPKGCSGKETRPIGIPETEDKLLQRAVVMLLEPIYEHDFLDCSHGFRAGRSAHQALDGIWRKVMGMGGGWVLDVDIRKFFDTLDHGVLRELVKLRVRDGVILRLIGKWLNAGVMEGDQVSYPNQGTPQGGVISPLLSNIYLHYVLDLWFEHTVKPRLRGGAELIRYADDFVIVFKERTDAVRTLKVLPKRFAKYGLTIHPDKTKLVRFTPASPEQDGKPGSFDFLGFTHFWGRSRRGNWVVKRKTAGKRFAGALKRVREWCRTNRHLKIADQWATLSSKLRGHYNYYGITGNSRALGRFWFSVRQCWRFWLNRRQRENKMTWERFLLLERTYRLPYPKAVRSVCAAKP